MGVRLFKREARGVAMTPEGHRFLARAEEALSLLGDANERWTPRRGPAVVRLSITPSLTSLWLFPRLAELERKDLHLELNLEHRLADFSDGTDLAIRCGKGPWAGIRSIQLWEEQAVPIAAPDIARTLGEDPPTLDLLAFPILHDSNVEGWRTWLSGAGLEYRPRAIDRRFEDFNLVIDACANGLGVALARPPLSDRAILSGAVVVVHQRSCINPAAYHLIRPAEPLRPAAADMARRLLAAAGKSEAEADGFVAAGRRK